MGKVAVMLVASAVLTLALMAQDSGVPPNAPPPRSSDTKADARRGASAGGRSAGESSSNDTKIPGDTPEENPYLPDVGATTDVDQPTSKPNYQWNPHKADHEVEVGDFYYKRKNYPAAIARYREALRWQDNHAVATFHLAEALEHTGQYAAARQSYQSYLRILPRGEYARDATKALARLKNKRDQKKDVRELRALNR